MRRDPSAGTVRAGALVALVAAVLLTSGQGTVLVADADAVFCTACGARNKVGSRFCLMDGAPLPVLDGDRYLKAFTPAPETFSTEETQQRLHLATRSVVRIRVKVPQPLRIPVAEPDDTGGYEFYRPGSVRVNLGRLVKLDEGQVAGSGFVISATGEVVTNAHVASPFGAQGSITIETHDGRSFPARLMGVDRASDLALLAVPGTSLPPLAWGDSEGVRLGEITWALGNPLDVGISVTLGSIATRTRMRAGVNQVESYLHSDAYITHGNSGGPLVNALGQVVGVTDIGLGAAKGNGYSIESNLARRVIERLKQNGRYERGFLGVHVSQVDASSIKRFALKARAGLVVESVLPGSPAETAGFRRGDVLFGINGRQAISTYLFQEAVSSVGPGKTLTIALDRGGQRLDLPATTVARPEEPRIDPVADLEGQMFVRFEEDPKLKRVVVRIPSTFSPSPRYGFLEGSVIESVVPAQDWPEEPLNFFDYKKKARPIPIAGLTDLRRALQRAYLGQRVGVAFEFRRPKNPIAAVAFDEIWAIVV